MADRTAFVRLTPTFVEAVAYAADKHATQTRKASQVPYLGHLLSVAGLVIEAGGTEKQAIAALLHDAAEDQGGERTLAEIARKFGVEVASIVAECSDTFETPKPPWRGRKERYIGHLRTASGDAVLVSLADKLDNARAPARLPCAGQRSVAALQRARSAAAPVVLPVAARSVPPAQP